MEDFLKILGSILIVIIALRNLFKKEKNADSKAEIEVDNSAQKSIDEYITTSQKQLVEEELSIEDKLGLSRPQEVKRAKVKKENIAKQKNQKEETLDRNKREKRKNNFIIDAKRDAKKALILGEILQKKY